MQTHNLASGLHFRPSPIEICEGCLYGKSSQQPFPRSLSSRSSGPLQLIHSDLCGPMPTISLTGSYYFLTLIDDFTKYTIIAFLKHKSEVLDHFIAYKNLVENQLDTRIKTIRTDNGGEYISTDFQAFCSNHGIRHQFTVPYTPQQNGVAERKNRTLLNSARAMLQVASLPNPYWEEAVADNFAICKIVCMEPQPPTPLLSHCGLVTNLICLIFASLAALLTPSCPPHYVTSLSLVHVAFSL